MNKPCLCLLLNLLIILSAAGGYPEAGEAEKIRSAARLVDRLGITQRYLEVADSAVQASMAEQQLCRADLQVCLEVIKEFFDEEVLQSREELAANLAEVYAAAYSEQELEEILRFFESPSGQAWLEKGQTVEASLDEIGYEWANQLRDRVLQMSQEAFKKLN
jgi:hypothetical protein